MVEVLIPGHRYKLDLFEDKNQSTEIQFIQKECINQETGELKTISDGITDEQLLQILIDRKQHQIEKLPCDETIAIKVHLQMCLDLQILRKKRRQSRNVEGTHLK